MSESLVWSSPVGLPDGLADDRRDRTVTEEQAVEDKPRVGAEMAALLRHRRASWWLAQVVMLGVVALILVRPGGNGLALGLTCVGGVTMSAVLVLRSSP